MHTVPSSDTMSCKVWGCAGRLDASDLRKEFAMSQSPSDAQDGRGDAPGIPRWVKITGLVLVALLLLIGAVMVLSGGQHGPGRHVAWTSTTEEVTERSATLSSSLLSARGLE